MTSEALRPPSKRLRRRRKKIPGRCRRRRDKIFSSSAGSSSAPTDFRFPIDRTASSSVSTIKGTTPQWHARGPYFERSGQRTCRSVACGTISPSGLGGSSASLSRFPSTSRTSCMLHFFPSTFVISDERRIRPSTSRGHARPELAGAGLKNKCRPLGPVIGSCQRPPSLSATWGFVRWRTQILPSRLSLPPRCVNP